MWFTHGTALPSLPFCFLAALPLVLGKGNPRDVLRYGTPQSMGMNPKPLRQMVSNLTAYTHAGNYSAASHYQIHPIEPGGVVIVGRAGTIVSEFAFGKQSLYADANGTLLPHRLQEDATVDTIYDIASLTKLFTTVAVLKQIDAGKIGLKERVSKYVPSFRVNGKKNITILMLLTHTSGFDADPVPSLYSDAYKTHAERIDAILGQHLLNSPGSTFLYSDLNFMTLMIVLETVTGRKLDVLIREITTSLDMHSTFFNKNNVEGSKNPYYRRAAVQEFQIEVLGSGEPARPQPVRGTVHDENAWALGGVSGHAGLFSTVRDTARFCQMILNNGTYGGRRILSKKAVDLIFTNFNAHFNDIDSYHGAGFELDQYYTAGPLNTTLVASHTGFTGTSLVVDRGRDLFYIQFSNRIHPTRTWSSNNIVRKAIGYWVGTSLGLNLQFP
ncbi:hypothetical protein LRP88_02084 [Fusarium phalaenopsidis]